MAARRRRLKRNTVIPVPPDRFAGGWRLVVDALPEFDLDLVVPPGGEPVETPSIVVDVAGGRDLVSLTAEFYGCELFNADDGPIVRPLPDADARMSIRLPYQHLGERAIYETPAPVPDPANPDSPPYPTDPGVDPPNARPDAAARRASGAGVPARVLDRRRGHDRVQHRRDPRRDGPPADDRPSAGDAEAGHPTHEVAGPDRRAAGGRRSDPLRRRRRRDQGQRGRRPPDRPRRPVPQPAPHAHDPVDAPRCGHPRRGHGRGGHVVDRRQRRRAVGRIALRPRRAS